MLQWKDLPYEDAPEYNEETDTLVRQSGIGQFQLCAGRVGYDGQKGHLQMVSEPLAFGTAVHYLISEHLIHGKQQDKLLQTMPKWVDDMLRDDYDWGLDKVPNVGGFFGEISAAYSRWINFVLPTLPDAPVLIEEEQRMYLGEGNSGNIFLKGTADAVYEDSLYDWKTAGRGWKPEKAAVSVQASLYMPLHKQTIAPWSAQKFTFWVFNRQSGAWGKIVTRRTIPQMNGALRTALEYGKMMEAGIYPCSPVPEASFNKKRGWYCSPKFCSAWNICKSKFMNDGVDEKVKAVRSW